MIPLPQSPQFRRLGIRIFALVLGTLLIAAAVAAALMFRSFDHSLSPELDKKGQAVARSLAREIGRAAGYGVPFDRLWGMDALLEQVLSGNPDIEFVIVSDMSGATLFAGGSVATPSASDPSAPIEMDGRRIGMVHLHISSGFIEEQLSAVFYDVLIVLLVAMLIALELVLIVLSAGLFRPLEMIDSALRKGADGDFTMQLPTRQHDGIGALARLYNTAVQRVAMAYQRLVDEAEEIRLGQIDRQVVGRIETLLAKLRERFRFTVPRSLSVLRKGTPLAIRAPLFVFILAEEMSRPFLPVYIRDLYSPIPGLSPDLVIGLPISVFMLMIAVVTPTAGRLTDRFGARRIFLLGVVPAVAGYLGSAFAQSLYDLVLWRAVAAIGYAAIYIACQGHVARSSTTADRARAMGMFMGAVFAAGVCGPALGGILADQIGFRATFAVAAAVSVLAGLMIYLLLDAEADSEGERRGLSWSDVRAVLANPGFAALVFLAAIPAKIALTGFLFYLAPLFLHALDNSAAEAGRIMMLYGVATVLLIPLVAQAADRVGRHGLMVSVGGLVSGFGLLPVLLGGDTSLVLVGILLLGVGHALSIPPQLALVPELCKAECDRLGVTTVLGIFRLLERIGNIVGPFIAGGLLIAFGYAGATAAIGLIVVTGSIAFAILAPAARSAAARAVAP